MSVIDCVHPGFAWREPELPLLFSPGQHVPVYSSLARSREHPGELQHPGARELFDYLALADIADAGWPGHLAPSANLAEYGRSQERIRMYARWLHEIFEFLRANAGGDAVWQPARLPADWHAPAARELGLLCGAHPVQPDDSNPVPKHTEAWIDVVLPQGRQACLVKLIVELERMPAPHAQQPLVHYVSALSAFLWIKDDWLLSFDHALAAAVAYVEQVGQRNGIGRGMAVRWHLQLDRLFDDQLFRILHAGTPQQVSAIDNARRFPLGGGSAGATFAAAVAQLLARELTGA